MSNNNKPVIQFRAFNVTASVFVEGKNKSVAITKSYPVKDKSGNKTGEYKETNSFFVDDLPRLALVANKAYEYCQLTETDNS